LISFKKIIFFIGKINRQGKKAILYHKNDERFFKIIFYFDAKGITRPEIKPKAKVRCHEKKFKKLYPTEIKRN